MLPVVLTSLGMYLLVGSVFAPFFALAGVDRIDPVAKGATVGFRLMVLPGAALLWPVLARRWILAARRDRPLVAGDLIAEWSPRSERLRVRALWMWLVLGPLMAAAVVLALAARPRAQGPSIDADRMTAETVP